MPPQFKCPYHGWTYDLTGKVKGVPERADFDPEHLKDLRSPQVAVDEWGGWVWVNLAGPDSAPSLQSWIGEEIMIDLGQYDMEDMVLLDVLEWDVPVSYKAIVDGFNEIYHTAELHHVDKAWTKSARDTSFWMVNDHNYMCFVPRHQHRDELARGLGSSQVCDQPLRRLPQHGLQLQPRTHPGVQPDPDRRRSHPLPVLGDRLPGRRERPGVRRLPPADAGPLGSPEGRRRRGHRDLRAAGTHEALERLPREHPERPRMQDRPLPRHHGADDPGRGVMGDRLTGKVAVITGASSGIGAASARRFVEEGAKVVVADVQTDLGEQVVSELGDAARFAECDVTDEAAIAAAIDLATATWGRLDVMFNNAGVVGAVGPVADTEAAAWARTIDILLTSVFYGCKHAARVMVPQGSGSIISTSSAAGILGGLGPHAYTASKAGVIALTKSVAAELGPQGVRCNAIAPGAVPTALTAHAMSGDVNDLEAVAESSRQRYGRAE